MSKDLFFQLRSQDVAYSYDFTKKEAKETGINLVKNVLDEGQKDPVDLACDLVRLNEVVSSALTEIKNNLPQEKINRLGVEINHVNGRETLNYSEDIVWQELKDELTQREALLKTAAKTDKPIYDNEGVEVTKVSTKFGKGYITIKF